MKKKLLTLSVVASLFSTQVLSSEKINTDDKLSYEKELATIKNKEKIEFGEYINSRPNNVILFETTTRMIDFEKSEAIITDVSKVTPPSIFKIENYIEVNPFTIDFSGIVINEKFNSATYPEKRIQEECSLMIEEYGLYIEGKFIGENIFYVDNLKPKKIHENFLTGYCDYKDKYERRKSNAFEETIIPFNEEDYSKSMETTLY